jgi:2-phosphoglycolate phosphatase
MTKRTCKSGKTKGTAVKIYKNNINDSKPFITKDSSVIRSILDLSNAKVKNQSLAEAVISGGKSTMAHQHRETEEIYYFTQGKGIMIFDFKHRFPVKKGDGVLIPPGTTHKLINTGKDDMKILCMCAPPYSHEDTHIMEKAYKLVIFDFDGTLVDSATGIWHTANEMAKKYKMKSFKRDFIIRQVGTGLDNFISDVFPGQVKQYGMKEVMKIYRGIYDMKYKDGLRIYRNVKQTLKYLYARGVLLAIASNKLKKYVDNINAELGINDYFDITLGSEDVLRRKPDPFVVRHLMKKYSVRKKDVLFVGDSQYDVETAKNAGVDCAYLTYGYADKKIIRKLKPEFYLDDFGSLTDMI